MAARLTADASATIRHDGPRVTQRTCLALPLPELSEYGFDLRYRGRWGVRLRLTRGRLEIALPSSDRSAIDVWLPDRTVRVQPGESCRLGLAD